MKKPFLFLPALFLLVACLALTSCANREAGNGEAEQEPIDIRFASLELRIEQLEEAVGTLRDSIPEKSETKAPAQGKAKGQRAGQKAPQPPAPQPVAKPVPKPVAKPVATPAPVAEPSPLADPFPTAMKPEAPASVPVTEPSPHGPALNVDVRTAVKKPLLVTGPGPVAAAEPAQKASKDNGPSLAPIGLPKAEPEAAGKAGPPASGQTVSAQSSPQGGQAGAKRPEVISRPGIPAYYDDAPKKGGKAVSAPAKTPPAQKGGTPQKGEALPKNLRSGNAAYDAALASYYAHDYTTALARFSAFIEHSPQGKLVPNAMYWMGESLYSKGDFSGAIVQLKKVASQFAKHPKAADALLKIGMAYERLKDMENARFYWQILVDDFPASSAAKVAKKRLAGK